MKKQDLIKKLKKLYKQLTFHFCFGSYSLLWRLGVVELDEDGLPKLD